MSQAVAESKQQSIAAARSTNLADGAHLAVIYDGLHRLVLASRELVLWEPLGQDVRQRLCTDSG